MKIFIKERFLDQYRKLILRNGEMSEFPAIVAWKNEFQNPTTDSAMDSLYGAIASCFSITRFRQDIVNFMRPYLVLFAYKVYHGQVCVYVETNWQLKVDGHRKMVANLEMLASLMVQAPYVEKLVKTYLVENGQYLVDVLQQADLDTQIRFVRIVYCVLRTAKTEFVKIVQTWKRFYAFCDVDNERVKWFAGRIMSAVLRLGEVERGQLLLKLKVEGSCCGLDALEEYAFGNDDHISSVVDGAKMDLKHMDLVDVYNVCLPRICKKKKDRTIGRIVHTKGIQDSLQQMAVAVGNRKPMLIQGPRGCGKTVVIQELARLMQAKEIVELHVDDQVDSKALFGTYVCSDVPGEFIWQEGPLTKAVRTGRWVVIEDINRAPLEVLSALTPLIENGVLDNGGMNGKIHPHDDFQLFATRCITSEKKASIQGFQETLWTPISMEAMSKSDVSEIIQKLPLPLNEYVVHRVLKSFEQLTNGCSMEENDTLQRMHNIQRRYGRSFSVRDLLKWCYRISTIALPELNVSSSYLTEANRLAILTEFHDVFGAWIPDQQLRSDLNANIAQIWEIDEKMVRHHILQCKPQFQVTRESVVAGRVQLYKTNQSIVSGSLGSYFLGELVLRTMQTVAAAVQTNEPLLLVGETGCGKTTMVQKLATSLGRTLVVQNLNVQSDSSELLGGYRPVDIGHIARPLYSTFLQLFGSTFDESANAKFIKAVRKTFEDQRFDRMITGMLKACAMAKKKFKVDRDTKMQKLTPTTSMDKWEAFEVEVQTFQHNREKIEANFAFSFVEGALVKAVKEGHWLLLDEINLASAETLERLCGLLDGATGTLSLTERGDAESLVRHKDFRLFAAMNPPTDAGKKDLPYSLRGRFTELFVDEISQRSDLEVIVAGYFSGIPNAPIEKLVTFYLKSREMADSVLFDGAQQKARYSLRTLCRAVRTARTFLDKGYGLERSLYEGLLMTFSTLLEKKSYAVMEKYIKSTFASSIKQKELTKLAPRPTSRRLMDQKFVNVASHWLPTGALEQVDFACKTSKNPASFIITKSVEGYLRHISRSIVIRDFPVLLQGPTSSGKTSLIFYIAARIGQKCVRINNHEHTDVQEYLGSYVPDPNGHLVFKDGILVEALKNGWWVILDELNLAPSEVLEALNRLLDDNREIYVPETQETIRPHASFMLFATQNPPGAYGGRKVLSRAFRSRFVEIQIDEVDSKELEIILQERCRIAPGFCTIMVKVMNDLQLHRQKSSLFRGKGGFITIRDLLRWAGRNPSTKEEVAQEGYYLLAERLRKVDEKLLVKRVLEKQCNVTLNLDLMYGKINAEEEKPVEMECSEQYSKISSLIQIVEKKPTGSNAHGNTSGLRGIAITNSLCRLFTLVQKCLDNKEPVLLVGETGCGKTTVCQLFSVLRNQNLQIVNCHQHSETSDLIGGLRPVRGKEDIGDEIVRELRQSILLPSMPSLIVERVDAMTSDKALQQKTLLSVCDLVLEELTQPSSAVLIKEHQLAYEQQFATLQQLKSRFLSFFEWHDGPLVSTMKSGDMILIDEINLAEDAVLERLNSVLEPSRTIVLAEKGGEAVDELVAANGWRILATMNPGGDFGKRELSPALRNRFTEIWVPSLEDADDMHIIISQQLRAAARLNSFSQLGDFVAPMYEFVQWVNGKNDSLQKFALLTVRDVVSWTHFISTSKLEHSDLGAWQLYVHGANMILLDGLSSNTGITEQAVDSLKLEALLMLVNQAPTHLRNAVKSSLEPTSVAESMNELSKNCSAFGISPFFIERGKKSKDMDKFPFSLQANTTSQNLFRVLRAMQINKPVLLEGSPGVGKTSLISSLAAAAGHNLVRINLSEQTDIVDLFGSDLPVDSSADGFEGAQFAWSDGVFLQALRAGDWVLLDELNLASQAVLEGLNSCLDHRATVFIPEIGREIACPPTFRVFAAQNPLCQGGGRKGLPQSFLNRFSQVYVDPLNDDDYNNIATTCYKELAELPSLLQNVIRFNAIVNTDVIVNKVYGREGMPWEFNLRDVFRWCDLMLSNHSSASHGDPVSGFMVLYYHRLRNEQDRRKLLEAFVNVFSLDMKALTSRIDECRSTLITPNFIQVGNSFLARTGKNVATAKAAEDGRFPVLSHLSGPLESIIQGINMKWPVLLIGPTGTAKTICIRHLARLSGNNLQEISMSDGIDATELLGCFEQADVSRNIASFLSSYHACIGKLQFIVLSQMESQSVLLKICQLSVKVEEACLTSVASSLLQKLGLAIKELAEMFTSLNNSKMLPARLQTDANSLIHQGNALLRYLNRQQHAGSFEWIDGKLINAMEAGDWILFENVNFCSSSVLDRLNSVLERGGELLVNECGIQDGRPRVVRPHSNFRIFFTMDARSGEVSRAMRNRCLEVFISNPLDFTGKVISTSSRLSSYALLRSEAITSFAVVRSLSDVFLSMCSKDAVGIKALCTFKHLSRWACQIVSMHQRGLGSLSWIAAQSFQSCFPATAFALTPELLKDILLMLAKLEGSSTVDKQMFPGVEPMYYTVAAVEETSQQYNAYQQSALLEFVLKNTDLSLLRNALSFLGSDSSNAKLSLDFAALYDSFLPEVLNSNEFSTSFLASLVQVSVSHCPRNESVSARTEWTKHIIEKRKDSEIIAAYVDYIQNLFEMHPVSKFLQKSILKLRNFAVSLSAHYSNETQVLHFCSLLDNLSRLPNCNQPLFAKMKHNAIQLGNAASGAASTVSNLLQNIQDSVDQMSQVLLHSWRRFLQNYDITSRFQMRNALKRQKMDYASIDSVWQCAYAIYARKIERNSVSNDMLPYIYALVMSIDQWLDNVYLTISEEEWVQKQRDAISAYCWCRSDFGDVLLKSSKQFPLDEFVLHFSKLVKAFNVVNACFPKIKACEALKLIQAVQTVIHASYGHSLWKGVLWKQEGHPSVPLAPMFLDSTKWIQAESTLNGSILMQKTDMNFENFVLDAMSKSSSLLYLTSDLQRDYLHALSTIEWSGNTERSLQNAKFSEEHLMDIVRKSRTAAKEKCLQELNDCVLSLAAEADLEESDLDPSQPISFRKIIAVRNLDEILYARLRRNWSLYVASPLLSYWLLSREHMILSRLFQCLVDWKYFLSGNPTIGEWKKVHLPNFKQIVVAVRDHIEDLLLLDVFRSPESYVGLQDIVWVSHRLFSTDDSEKDIWSDWTWYDEIILFLNRKMHSMYAAFQQQCWLLRNESEIIPITKQGIAMFVDRHNCVESGMIFQKLDRVMNARKFKISDMEFIRDQLRTLSNHFESRQPPSLESRMQQVRTELVSSFWSMLIAFKQTFKFGSELHAAFTEYNSTGCSENLVLLLCKIVESSTDTRWNEFGRDLTLPLIDMIFGQIRCDVHVQGRSWIYLGVLRLLLVSPACPLDPAIKTRMKIDGLHKIRQSYMGIHAASNAMQSTYSYSKAPMSIVSDIRQLDDLLRVKELKCATRPNGCPSYAALYRVVSQFGASISMKIVESVSSNVEDIAKLDSEMSLYQEITSSLVSNLVSSYQAFYPDVVDPILVALYQIKNGINMYLQSFQKGTEKQASINNLVAVPNEIQILTNVEDLLSDATLTFDVEFFRMVLTSLGRCKDSGKLLVGSELYSVAHQVLGKLVSRYVEWKSEQAGIAAENAKSLIVHTKTPDALSTEIGMSEEDEFRRDFPMLDDAMFEKTINDSTTATPIHAATFTDAFTVELFDFHRLFYTGAASHDNKKSISSNSISRRQERQHKLRVAITLAPLHNHWIVNNAMKSFRSSTAFMACHDTHFKYFNGGVSEESDSTAVLDFYQDFDVAGVHSFLPILQNCLGKVALLLKKYSENQLLQSIARLCCSIRNFALSSTSCGQLLSFANTLFKKMQDWEEVCLKIDSFSVEMQTIGKIIIRWREKELASWHALLEKRKMKYENEAKASWYSLYSLLKKSFPSAFAKSENDLSTWYSGHQEEFCGDWVFSFKEQEWSSPDSKPWIKELFQTLDLFLRSSKLGEIQTRLSLLSTFAAQISLELKNGVYSREKDDIQVLSAISCVLLNVVKFYEQFMPAVNAFWNQVQMPLEKKLKEFIKINKWDEQSYYALKESTEKAHRKLFQFAKAYENEILVVPLQFIIDQSHSISKGLTYSHESSKSIIGSMHKSFPCSGVKTAQDNVDSICEIVREFNKFEYSKFKNVDITPINDESELISLEWQNWSMKAMSLLETNCVTLDRVQYRDFASELCNDLCSAIFTRQEHLKKFEKKVQMKRKALHDLFINLHKEQGISHLQSHLMQEHQFHSSIFSLKSGLPPCIERNICRMFEQGDAYYFKFLDQLTLVRFSLSGTKELSPAISWNERNKMSGIMENCLSLILQQRLGIQAVADNCSRLSTVKQQLANLNTLQDQNPVYYNDSVKRNYCHVIEMTEELLEFVHSYSPDDRDRIFSSFPLKTWVQGAAEYGTLSMLAFYDNILKAITEKRKNIIQHSALVIAFDVLGEKIAHYSSTLRVQRVPASPHEHVGDSDLLKGFVTKYEPILQQFLLIIQKLVKLEKNCVNSTDDTDSLMAYHQYFMELSKVSSTNGLLQQLVNLYDEYRIDLGSPRKTVNKDIIHGMLRNLSPLIDTYHTTITSFLANYTNFCRNFTKLAFVVTRVFRSLLVNGFCAPIEDEEDSDGDNDDKEMGGVGMGEGEGKNDVSEEIEDEEQLLGLRGDEQNEQQPRDEQDENKDTGMEMSTDFDGALENLDSDENNENDDENEQEQLDREMGDIDQEDENVIDEKLWNGDDDDADDNEGDEKTEKFEENAETSGQQDENEIHGKDNEQEDSKKPKEQNSESIENDFESDSEGGVMEEETEENHNINPAADAAMNSDDEDGGDSDTGELPEDIALDDGKLDDLSENDEASDGEDENPNGIDSLDPEGANADSQDEDDAPEDDDTHDTLNEQTTGEMGAEQEVEPNAPEEVENIEKDDDGEPSTKKEEQMPTAFGLNDKDGGNEPTFNEKENDDSGGKQDINTNTAPSPETQNQDVESTEQSSSRQGESLNESAETADVENTEDQGKQSQQKQEPNPYRSVGDATKHWQRRMNVLEMEDDNAEDPMDCNEESSESASTVMHMKEDNKTESDSLQTLAPALDAQPLGTDESTMEEEKDNVEEQSVEDSDHQEMNDTQNISKVDVHKSSASTNDVPKEEMEKPLDLSEKEEDVSDDAVPMNSEDGDIALSDKVEIVRNPIIHTGMIADLDEKALNSEENPFTDIDPMSMELLDRDTHDQYQREWLKLESDTASSAQRLCEQLRVTLEPTLRNRLQGDYRNGKRINMRKIIPYIASSFRKDKIWMKRKKASKRQYQVIIAIDDSESMLENDAGKLAIDATCILVKAMTQLEIGDIGIVNFGIDFKYLHGLHQPFTSSQGGNILSQFTFKQPRTELLKSIYKISDILESAKSNSSGTSVVEYSQLVFLLSDGRFDQGGREKIKSMVRNAMENQQLFVLVIIDTKDEKNSILNTQKVSFDPKGKINMAPYLDEFPFSYYLILHEAQLLPEVLSDALRQWFEMLN